MTESTKVPVKAEAQAKTAVPKAEGWHPFDTLRQQLDRVLDDFDRGFGRSLFSRSMFDFEPLFRREASWGISPAVDIVEHDKEYLIEAEVPGLDEKNLEVSLVNNILHIKGEKKEEHEEKKKNSYLSERRYGAFERTFQVPPGVDTARIDASFAKGVLKLTLPKTADAINKEKKISVKAG
jgi:HSP20 family protein